jgi:class 3 adenylate cyclase
LITDQTYELVAERIVAEKLSRIQVKGKGEPVQVYQVIALK